MQAHFRPDAFEPPGQEVGRTHPGLEGTEGMLHRLAPDAHAIAGLIHSDLHGFQSRFMLPARHTALLAGCAHVLDHTARAP